MLFIALRYCQFDLDFRTLNIANWTAKGAGEEEANAAGREELKCEGDTAVENVSGVQRSDSYPTTESVPMVPPLS